MAPTREAREDASATWSALGAAVRGAWDDARTLVAQHAALASREAAARTSGLGVDLALLVVGALCVHSALLSLFAALGFALHEAGASPWFAAIAVTVLATLVALGALLTGLQRFKQRTRPPSQTLLALRETSAWLSDTAGRLGR